MAWRRDKRRGRIIRSFVRSLVRHRHPVPDSDDSCGLSAMRCYACSQALGNCLCVCVSERAYATSPLLSTSRMLKKRRGEEAEGGYKEAVFFVTGTVHAGAPRGLSRCLSARARFAELEWQIPRGFRGQVREECINVRGSRLLCQDDLLMRLPRETWWFCGCVWQILFAPSCRRLVTQSSGFSLDPLANSKVRKVRCAL